MTLLTARLQGLLHPIVGSLTAYVLLLLVIVAHPPPRKAIAIAAVGLVAFYSRPLILCRNITLLLTIVGNLIVAMGSTVMNSIVTRRTT